MRWWRRYGGVHPLQVDSVAWVSELKNLLSTGFWLLTIAVYFRYVRAREEGARHVERGERGSPPGSLGWYVLLLVVFGVGLLSKPMLVTLPVILLLLDVWPLRRVQSPKSKVQSFGEDEVGARHVERGERGSPPGEKSHLTRALSPRGEGKVLLEKAPMFLMSVVIGLITIYEHKKLGLIMTTEQLSLMDRVSQAVVSYGIYLWKIIWPTKLAIYYPIQPVPGWQVAVAALALLCITVLVLQQFRRRPYLLVGWGWFLLTLVPVIGLLQVNDQARADRFLYLPFIGVCWMVVFRCWEVVAQLGRGWNHALPGWVIGIGVLGACVARTENQLPHWRTSETLFTHALKVTKNNGTAHLNLGIALMHRGAVDEALPHLVEAARLRPNSGEAQGMLGNALSAKGDKRGAIQHYRKALELNPKLAEALNNLAWLLATTKDDALRNGREAVRLASQACELTRYEQATMIGTLAAAYAEAGEFERAVAMAEKAQQVAREMGQASVAEANLRLMEMYKEGKAVREP